VCSHEEIEIGALFECHRRVLKVPTNMAIISLEGSSMGEHAYPSLTSAEFDYERMGAQAAEKLLQAIKCEPVDQSTRMDFKLIRRASTAVN